MAVTSDKLNVLCHVNRVIVQGVNLTNNEVIGYSSLKMGTVRSGECLGSLVYLIDFSLLYCAQIQFGGLVTLRKGLASPKTCTPYYYSLFFPCTLLCQGTLYLEGLERRNY